MRLKNNKWRNSIISQFQFNDQSQGDYSNAVLNLSKQSLNNINDQNIHELVGQQVPDNIDKIQQQLSLFKQPKFLAKMFNSAKYIQEQKLMQDRRKQFKQDSIIESIMYEENDLKENSTQAGFSTKTPQNRFKNIIRAKMALYQAGQNLQQKREINSIFQKNSESKQISSKFREHDFGPQYRDGKLLEYSILGKAQPFLKNKEMKEKSRLTRKLSLHNNQSVSYQKPLLKIMSPLFKKNKERPSNVTFSDLNSENSQILNLQKQKQKIFKINEDTSDSQTQSPQFMQLQSNISYNQNLAYQIKLVDRSVLIDQLNETVIRQEQNKKEDRKNLKKLLFSDQLGFTKDQRSIQKFQEQNEIWQKISDKLQTKLQMNCSKKRKFDLLIDKMEDYRKKKELKEIIEVSRKGELIQEKKFIIFNFQIEWQVMLRRYFEADPNSLKGQQKNKMMNQSLDQAIMKYDNNRNKKKIIERDFEKEEQTTIQRGQRFVEASDDLPIGFFIPTIEAEQPILTKIRRPQQRQVKMNSSLNPISIEDIMIDKNKNKNFFLKKEIQNHLESIKQFTNIKEKLIDFQMIGKSKYNLERSNLLKNSNSNSQFIQIKYPECDTHNPIELNKHKYEKPTGETQHSQKSVEGKNNNNDIIFEQTYDKRVLSKQGQLYFPKLKLNF